MPFSFCCYIKSDCERVFPSGCHHFFSKKCRNWFVKEIQELESKTYNFSVETNMELNMGEGAEKNQKIKTLLAM